MDTLWISMALRGCPRAINHVYVRPFEGGCDIPGSGMVADHLGSRGTRIAGADPRSSGITNVATVHWQLRSRMTLPHDP